MENKLVTGVLELRPGSKAAAPPTYGSLIVRGALVEQLAAILLGCDGGRQVDGDHLQQGISSWQPPPHHGLGRAAGPSQRVPNKGSPPTLSPPPNFPSRLMLTQLEQHNWSAGPQRTQTSLTFSRGLPSLSLSSLSSLMSSFSISLAASSFLKFMIASKT